MGFLKSLLGDLLSRGAGIDFRQLTFTVRADIGGPDLYPNFVKEFHLGPIAARVELGDDNSDNHWFELSGIYIDVDA